MDKKETNKLIWQNNINPRISPYVVIYIYMKCNLFYEIYYISIISFN